MAWWRRRSDQLEEEIQNHIDLETQQRIEAGEPPDQARHAAMAKFGNIVIAKEESREIWGWLWIDRLWQDLRYALRGFSRSPNFTAVALLSLMLGIGASTALFSVVYGVLIAPYPYAKPDEIWAPFVLGPKDQLNSWHQYTRREFLQIQKLPAFSDVMATGLKSVLLTGGLGPERFYGVFLTGNAFNFIGVKPLVGRTVQPFDIRSDGEPEPVVVLSYRLWERLFNGDRNAIGKRLVLDDVPHTVIGVMPPRFGWWTNEAFWLPMPMNLTSDTPINAIMRLQPGVTRTAAEQQLQKLNERLARDTPQNFPKGRLRTVLQNYMDITQASGEMTTSLHLLFGAVGFLLLIACLNVANLQLTRTTTRAREIAVRLSIGANRSRLVRQLLTESVLLALVGGVLGVLFAIAATRAIAALIPEDYIPNEARITVNGFVLAFSFLISVLSGVLFGIAPAVQCSRPDLTDALKDGGRGSAGSVRGQKTRTALVIAEVAISVILLSGASVVIRSFANLLSVNPGFQQKNTLMVEVPLPPNRYTTFEQRNSLSRALLGKVSLRHGVEAAAMGNGGMPFGGPESSYTIFGHPATPDRHLIVNLISDNYLRTLGIPLKQGRSLNASDIANNTHVALINQAFTKLLTPGESSIGKVVKLDLFTALEHSEVLAPVSNNPDFTVVGVIGDTRNTGLRSATAPAIYVPYASLAPPSRTLAVRTTGEPMSVLNDVRRAVQELDKSLPLGRPITLNEILGLESVEPRFSTALFTCLATLGLILAAIGLYSVVSYDVTQRTHEIGIKLALGATRKDVLTNVLQKAGRMSIFGTILGVLGSLVLERLVQFQVFAAARFDLASCAAVCVALALVAFLASWWPAARAGSVDPVTALRHEA